MGFELLGRLAGCWAGLPVDLLEPRSRLGAQHLPSHLRGCAAYVNNFMVVSQFEILFLYEPRGPSFGARASIKETIDEEPIQMVFDFTMDLAELEAAA